MIKIRSYVCPKYLTRKSTIQVVNGRGVVLAICDEHLNDDQLFDFMSLHQKHSDVIEHVNVLNVKELQFTTGLKL